MRAFLQTLSVVVALGFNAQISAEVLSLSVGEQGNSQIATPRKGATKSQISHQYGEPLQKLPAVGKPPISQWVYSEFTVYFEYDHVVHSVLKHHSAETTENPESTPSE